MRWPQDHTGGGEVDALAWVLSGGRMSTREPRIAGFCGRDGAEGVNPPGGGVSHGGSLGCRGRKRITTSRP